MSPSPHIPVLAREVIEVLAPREGETYLDATVGLGGHASAFAPRVGPTGRLLLNDLDESNLRAAEQAVRAATPGLCPTIARSHANFAELAANVSHIGWRGDILLADLGFASPQVDNPDRGFSFTREGPLDMRFDRSQGVSAAELVATLPEEELERIIREFGEERAARAIARKLVAARRAGPISTTSQLADLVRSVVRVAPGQGLDPATKAFQALRIAVNDELGALDALLRDVARAPGGNGWLSTGARVGVITFHSLEDRPVKQAFARLVRDNLAEPLINGHLQAGPDEIASNPRARSAKFRAIRLLGAPRRPVSH